MYLESCVFAKVQRIRGILCIQAVFLIFKVIELYSKEIVLTSHVLIHSSIDMMFLIGS